MVPNNHPPAPRELWCLRRSKSDVRCVLRGGAPVEVQVLQDRDVVLTEVFENEVMALGWSKAYGDQLRSQGWFDSPLSRSKAS